MKQITDFISSELGIKVLTVLVAIITTYVLTTIVKRIIPKYVAAADSRYKARKFVNFIGYAILVVTVFIIFSNQLTGLTVFIGVAGAGIAFALQEVIASIAGYIAIHTSSFYKVGDRVLVGGIKGDVIDVGILRTSLMEIGEWVNGDLYNGRITRVANSFIFSQPVHNYSGEFPFLWDEMKIAIKTSSDFEYGRQVFTDLLNGIKSDYAKEAQEHWDKMTNKFMVEKAQVDPMVSMAFDENWITFTLRYVVDYKSRRSTKDQLSTAILNAINNSDGKLKVASSAIEITAFPEQKKL